jgi:hypothetical protein
MRFDSRAGCASAARAMGGIPLSLPQPRSGPTYGDELVF